MADNKPDTQSQKDALITTAVNFLQNENVRRSPLSQKQKFLRSKGLTENEIQIALEKAGVFSSDPNTVINLGINSSQAQHSKNLVVHQLQPPSLFSKFKDFINSAAVLSGVIYVIYKFYKNYIEPFVFGRKKKSIKEQLNDIDTKVETCISKLGIENVKIQEEILANKNEVLRELNNFKNDIEAIKGLLLNRKQFANPFPIPAWQLESSKHRHQADDKHEDAGSGSGSSETEIVVKNSDSSIEIM